MKKITILAFLILVVAVAGIVMIKDTHREPDMAGVTRVGVLISGSSHDRNYCQAHYDALESLKGDLPIELIYREKVGGDCYNDIAQLIENENCRIIIGISFDHGRDMEKAAEAYPDIYFIHTTGTEHRSNLSTGFGRMYQVRYLSGIVAGMRTETGKIGYVAAFPIPEVIRGINAFALGVRSVRPDAQVYVRYCHSWTEDKPAGEAFDRLIAKYPIDVMALHTNSLEPNRYADMRGIWSIGCNLDNAHVFSKTYLTACVWKWDAYYRRELLQCLQGKFHGKHVWMKMEDGIVSLSDLTENVRPGTEAKVKAAEERLRSREYDVFYGPIKDNAGHIRVEAGESMPDDEMLNGFDWYVEGVTVEL